MPPGLAEVGLEPPPHPPRLPRHLLQARCCCLLRHTRTLPTASCLPCVTSLTFPCAEGCAVLLGSGIACCTTRYHTPRDPASTPTRRQQPEVDVFLFSQRPRLACGRLLAPATEAGGAVEPLHAAVPERRAVALTHTESSFRLLLNFLTTELGPGADIKKDFHSRNLQGRGKRDVQGMARGNLNDRRWVSKPARCHRSCIVHYGGMWRHEPTAWDSRNESCCHCAPHLAHHM